MPSPCARITIGAANGLNESGAFFLISASIDCAWQLTQTENCPAARSVAGVVWPLTICEFLAIAANMASSLASIFLSAAAFALAVLGFGLKYRNCVRSSAW